MTHLGDERWQSIKAVIFDVGGVLIDLHSHDASRELTQKYGLKPEAFARMTRSSFESYPRSITELTMIGQLETAEYLDAFLRECTLKDLDGLRINRLAVLGRERANVFAIVEDLKHAGFICCVLSNTIGLHWDKLSSTKEYPSFALFDHVFLSHRIKCAKPEKTAFSFVTNALKLRPAECLLIDDTIVNIDGAKAAGWRTVLFTDPVQLQHDISSLLPA